jgi:hypothetical protein
MVAGIARPERAMRHGWSALHGAAPLRDPKIRAVWPIRH